MEDAHGNGMSRALHGGQCRAGIVTWRSAEGRRAQGRSWPYRAVSGAGGLRAVSPGGVTQRVCGSSRGRSMQADGSAFARCFRVAALLAHGLQLGWKIQAALGPQEPARAAQQ